LPRIDSGAIDVDVLVVLDSTGSESVVPMVDATLVDGVATSSSDPHDTASMPNSRT
jgi:hypothetical protein